MTTSELMQNLDGLRIYYGAAIPESAVGRDGLRILAHLLRSQGIPCVTVDEDTGDGAVLIVHCAQVMSPNGGDKSLRVNIPAPDRIASAAATLAALVTLCRLRGVIKGSDWTPLAGVILVAPEAPELPEWDGETPWEDEEDDDT